MDLRLGSRETRAHLPLSILLNPYRYTIVPTMCATETLMRIADAYVPLLCVLLSLFAFCYIRKPNRTARINVTVHLHTKPMVHMRAQYASRTVTWSWKKKYQNCGPNVCWLLIFFIHWWLDALGMLGQRAMTCLLGR